MNATTARVLRQYATKTLPDIVVKKYPEMQASLYRLFKRWWTERFNNQERAGFRRLAAAGKPLPDALKQEARQRGIIVEWPPRQGG